ncbi:heavy-metal-associated domain-containing protein [Ideonella dechloratans]|uniref:Heavy-metal-associated domain-containing protein n=1 Tax=Ideonella dechloratans TaxID=36863 RepID=A0A643FHX1_IDEDE|nr:heavy-metal-associated domain-containing protein [Ideonella dechloratans]KAB0584217.1 heavy-metal-associated domain-containing protein [Ideonella dechloratans]UFU08564.1 heavy-metal-associated domain-containing protein [Ideonella dechloratans]
MSQFLVPDMTCGHCVKAITAAVTAADPTATLQIDLPSHVVSVSSQTLSDDALLETLREAGYSPTLQAA